MIPRATIHRRRSNGYVVLDQTPTVQAQQCERRRGMKATTRKGKRERLQKQQAGAVLVEFYGYGHNPWTWEQALEAYRRNPEKDPFIRRAGELKEDAEAKMRDSRIEL